MNQQTTLFSNEKMMAMIIPLFLEHGRDRDYHCNGL